MPQPHPRRMRLALATATAAALTGGLLTFGAAPATAADTDRHHKADFNGDGYGDAAFAAPYAKLGDKGSAGYVAVVDGGPTGLDPAHRTTVSQDTAGVPDTVETEDTFGSALATADFNNDGYTDLAVGASGENGGDGSVTVLWGSASGLANGTVVADPAPAAHGEWGKTLAAGDFDGDGKADLAVGSDSPHAYVISGGVSGPAQRIDVPEKAYAVDAMDAGDTNGDGKADLVLTYRTDLTTDPSGSWSKGMAYLGSPSGLDTSVPRPLNGGTSIALGDIDGDGYDELALGNVFSEVADDNSDSLGGRVVVIRGGRRAARSTATPPWPNSPSPPREFRVRTRPATASAARCPSPTSTATDTASWPSAPSSRPRHDGGRRRVRLKNGAASASRPRRAGTFGTTEHRPASRARRGDGLLRLGRTPVRPDGRRPRGPRGRGRVRERGIGRRRHLTLLPRRGRGRSGPAKWAGLGVRRLRHGAHRLT